jgi:ATP-binding cassette, subfamily F, member 3
MFSVNNLGIHFNGEWLFRHAGFMVQAKERIGLVGRNGAGKSTLLKIMAGLLEPQEGSVVIPAGYQAGYLRQHLSIDSEKSVIEGAKEAFAELTALRQRMDELTMQIAERTDYENPSYLRLIEEYNHDEERFRLLDGMKTGEETEKVLKGLGFNPSDFDRPIRTFSGGWQMRIELARLLLCKDELLLLDEPTNHLDIESIQWLENFLQNYPGAVIIVSHDRTLLDRLTNRTIEMELGKLSDYKAGYAGYVELRKQKLELQAAAFGNQQKQIDEIEDFIERFRYKASKAKQVQSRIKMLDKMDRIEVEETDKSSLRFRFPPAPRSGKVVVEADGLGKAYGELKVLENLSFGILRGEFIAFVGKNGEGKTTLSRVLVGELEHEGKLQFGHNVKIGYYAQDQADKMDPELTVFQTIDAVATGDMRPRVRSLLGNFLFSDENVDKKVKVLSGGEKSRLALARLMLEPYNLLVLDEPTNHLDMVAKDVLKNALLQYDGTLLLVSHDRDFLNGLTDRIFEFRNRQIKEYRGDIYEFLEERKLGRLDDLGMISSKQQGTRKDSPSENKLLYEMRKTREREMRKLKTRVESIEDEIHEHEAEKARLELAMSDPSSIGSNYMEIAELYNKTNRALNEAMLHWEQAHEELDAMSKQEMNPES